MLQVVFAPGVLLNVFRGDDYDEEDEELEDDDSEHDSDSDDDILSSRTRTVTDVSAW